jgi:vacuolar protein sorting-associated protein 13D
VFSVGRSIAELQVGKVHATFVKKPFETSLGLSVHSLLIVDAFQTLGSDFELLVASHRNLW